MLRAACLLALVALAGCALPSPGQQAQGRVEPGFTTTVAPAAGDASPSGASSASPTPSVPGAPAAPEGSCLLLCKAPAPEPAHAKPAKHGHKHHGDD